MIVRCVPGPRPAVRTSAIEPQIRATLLDPAPWPMTRRGVQSRALALVPALGAVAMACGAEEMPGVPRIGTSPGKVIYATWGSQRAREAEHWTLLAFEKNYTDLKVDLAVAADTELEYLARLEALIASGSDPDVMRLPGQDAPTYFARGSTMKLDALIRRDKFQTNTLSGPFDGATYRKAWHAFPRGRASAWGIFYDRARMASVAKQDPAPAWTWDDFLDLSRRLADPRSDRWAISLDPLASFPLPWIWGAGADDLDREGLVPQWEEPGARDALSWLHALRHHHRVAPPAGHHAGIDGIASGRVSMWFGCADDELALRRAGAPDFGFAPQPRGRASQSAAWHPDVVAIGGRGPSPDDAWEFLQFLVDPDTQQFEYEHGLWLPHAKSITDASGYRLPAASPHDRRGGIAGALLRARSPVLTATSGRMRRAVADALTPFWKGDVPVDRASRAANEAASAALGG